MAGLSEPRVVDLRSLRDSLTQPSALMHRPVDSTAPTRHRQDDHELRLERLDHVDSDVTTSPTHLIPIFRLPSLLRRIRASSSIERRGARIGSAFQQSDLRVWLGAVELCALACEVEV